MKTGRVGSESAVPWWAAFGAPLIGVPLMVLLLAVGSPAEPTGDATPLPGEEATPVDVRESLPEAPTLPATMVELDLADATAARSC